MNWDDYPNFTESEFKCSHTGKVKMHPEFMRILQQIRDVYGKPMPITSGYRDVTHPIEAKKSKPGEHTYGLCADIKADRNSQIELVVIAYGLGLARFGLNFEQEFIHIGIGDQKAGFYSGPWTY